MNYSKDSLTSSLQATSDFITQVYALIKSLPCPSSIKPLIFMIDVEFSDVPNQNEINGKIQNELFLYLWFC